MVSIRVGNAYSQIAGPDESLWKLLRHELSHPVSEPGQRVYHQSDGSVKIAYWDGYRCLVTRQGGIPSGLVPRAIRLLNKWRVPLSVTDDRRRPADPMPRWSLPPDFALRPYQHEACGRGWQMTRGVFDSPPRCVAGDCRVQINRGGKTFWVAMRDLVHRFNGGVIRAGKGAVCYWDAEIPTTIRAADADGMIRLFDIHSAWSAGEKEVLRLRLASGAELVASADHRIQTIRGWVPLGEIRKGDAVFAEVPRGGGVVASKPNYAFISGLVGHPFAGRRDRKKGSFCVQIHRLVYEAHLNGLAYEKYLEMLRLDDCEGLRFLDPQTLVVHHVDGNPKNNLLDNLEVLDRHEHLRKHGLAGGWKHVNFRVGPIPVVFVDRAGSSETYDLEVPGAENFLVNKIVTHNSGKTVMMAEMCRQVADTTVITAPTVATAKQTHEKLQELLICHQTGWSEGRPEDEIQLLTGGPPKSQRARRELLRAVITVCTAKTASSMSESWWDRVRCLMVDERHHQAALGTYGKINYLAKNAFYRWGFTGTNYRSSPGEQVALEACLGRVVASYSPDHMRSLGVIVPASVRLLRCEARPVKARKFDSVYRQGVVACDGRNQVAAFAARQLQREGRRVLVLVGRIEHGERLAKMIPDSKFVQGKDGDEVRQAVAQLSAGELTCVIGSPVVGEGLDIPSADALVYAKGLQARVTHTQDTFRVLTGDGKKRDAVIVDFVDAHNHMLLDHSVARMKNYVALGLQVFVDSAPVDLAVSPQLGLGLAGGDL